MSVLLEWWSFIWQLYLSALNLGGQWGGVPMLLIWVMASAAAFSAMVVAPIVFVAKLAVFAFIWALKAALVALFVGAAVETVKAIEPQYPMTAAQIPKLVPIDVEPDNRVLAHQSEPASQPDPLNRICQRIQPADMSVRVMDHLLKTATGAVDRYNADIEFKVKELKTLGEDLPLALIHEGLNPGFRMTPPQLSDLQQIASIGTPKVVEQVEAGAAAQCTAELPVQLGKGPVLLGTLRWMVLEAQARAIEFEASTELTDAIHQLGIDLNLPLYHLTHHRGHVQLGYYEGEPDKQRVREAEAVSAKDRLYQKYHLPVHARLSVPMS